MKFQQIPLSTGYPLTPVNKTLYMPLTYPY